MSSPKRARSCELIHSPPPPRLSVPPALALRVPLPGDLGGVRRAVAAVVDVASGRVLGRADPASGACDRGGGGEEALGDAADRVVGLGIAEFRHAVTVAQKD